MSRSVMRRRPPRGHRILALMGVAAILAAALAALGCARSDRTTTSGGTSTVTMTPADTTGQAAGAAARAGGTMPVPPATTPDRIQVQHILIGFSGSVPGKSITRTEAEARTLAYQILDRARAGEDFDALVRQYTDDSPPGIYGMSGRGVAPASGEFPRDQMVPAFGNVGFALSPGNIGMADYHPIESPFGWHIIKRLR